MTEDAKGAAEDAKPPAIGTLVMVDDDVIDRMLHRRIVERSGLVGELLDFGSADAALAFIASRACPTIDAVIADLNMPRMNGFELLDELGRLRYQKEELSRCVVTVLTTSSDPRDEERARRNRSVKAFFHKPFADEHLRRIADLLDG